MEDTSALAWRISHAHIGYFCGLVKRSLKPFISRKPCRGGGAIDFISLYHNVTRLSTGPNRDSRYCQLKIWFCEFSLACFAGTGASGTAFEHRSEQSRQIGDRTQPRWTLRFAASSPGLARFARLVKWRVRQRRAFVLPPVSEFTTFGRRSAPGLVRRRTCEHGDWARNTQLRNLRSRDCARAERSLSTRFARGIRKAPRVTASDYSL